MQHIWCEFLSKLACGGGALCLVKETMSGLQVSCVSRPVQFIERVSFM